MKKVNPPKMKYSDVFDCCVNSIRDANTRSLLTKYKSFFLEASKEYNHLGNTKRLQDFDNKEGLITQGSDDFRQEIIKMFEKFKKNKTNLPSINKSPSELCDEIKSLSRMCLYCNIGFANTLDHYLPKDKFPLISIEPSNLIPCCRDCNSDLNYIYNANNPLIIHPYFEHDTRIYDTQWIFAKIPTNHPFFCEKKFDSLAIEFYFDFSNSRFDTDTQDRLKFKFKHLLLEKYRDSCAETISSELNRIRRYKGTVNQVSSVNKKILLGMMSDYHVNSLNYVTYHALANSQVYLDTIENEFY